MDNIVISVSWCPFSIIKVAWKWVKAIPLGTIEVNTSERKISPFEISEFRCLDFEYRQFRVIVLPFAIVPIFDEVSKGSKAAFSH